MTKKWSEKCSSVGTVLANRAESPGSDIHHCIKWVWYTCLKSQHSGARSSRNSRSSVANQRIAGQPRLYESPSQKNKQATVTYRKNINKAKTHCQQNRNYMLGSKGLRGKCYFFPGGSSISTHKSLLIVTLPRKEEMAILFNDTNTSLYLHEDPCNHFTQKLCNCFGMQSALMITRRRKTEGILSWPSISLPNAFSRPERELWKPFLSVGPKFTSQSKIPRSPKATSLQQAWRPWLGPKVVTGPLIAVPRYSPLGAAGFPSVN